MQIALIEEARTRVSGERVPSAAAISMMIAERARAVTMEQAVGAVLGHAEIITEVGRLLEVLEPNEGVGVTRAR